MGSDFTYEDMSIGRYKENFIPKTLKEEKEFYLLVLVPKGKSNISYSKVVLKIDKKYMLPVRIDFYRKGEKKPYKTLYQKEIELIENIPTPKKIIMKNNITGSETVLEIISVDYKTPIKDEVFTLRGLRKEGEL